MNDTSNFSSVTTLRDRLRTFRQNRLLPLFKEYRFLLLCGIIPAILIFLVYLVRGLHPFGDGCVLVLDLNGQYVWFFEALRNFVRGDAELLYSFSRALGGEFLGIFAYYIASPLSFLVCLFPADRMLEALLCLFVLKTALCGVTFGYYAYKTALIKNKYAIILFSAFYALSAYAVVQQHNTMWIDAVMWLPLITLGIESVIRYGRFKLYVVSMAVAVFSNYYIGYMLCIWCFLYAIVFYAAHPRAHVNPVGERAHLPRSILRMLGYSVLAIGIAAIVILGAYYSLNFGKTTFSDPEWVVSNRFDLLDFFYKLLPGSYDTVRVDGLPFVYCGMLTLLLLPSYFLSKKVPLRQKILFIVLLGLLYLSASISIVDLIWHGFQAPNWLNYRYSFLFTFILCVLACRAFSDMEAVSLRTTLITGGFIALLCVVLQTYQKGEHIEPNDYTCIYFSIVALIVYLAIFSKWKRSSRPRLVRSVLCGAVALELFLNALFCINALDIDTGFSRYSIYNDFLDDARPIVEEVQKDDAFYRMEKTFFRSTNDNMALNIRGLSGSSSTLNKETVALLSKFGYASRDHWSKYLGGTPVTDSLFGLKYIVSDNDVYADYYEPYITDPDTGYVAYYNPYALSLAFGVDDDLLAFPMGYISTDKADENNNNEATLDENKDIYLKVGGISTAVDTVKDAVNALLGIEENNGDTYIDEYESPFERINAILTAMLGEEETVRVFVPITEHKMSSANVYREYIAGNEYGYIPTSSETKGTVTFTLTAPNDREIFFCMPTEYARKVSLSLSVSGSDETVDLGVYNDAYANHIGSVGTHAAGDTLSLTMTLEQDALYMKRDGYYFYYMDRDVFQNVMQRLSADQYQIDEFTEHSFKGSFTASRADELVLTTIPYDNGWQILVDGEPVELEKALGGLIAFRLEGDAGQTHTVEMVYRPRAVFVGIIISVASILLFIGLIVLDRFYSLGCRPKRSGNASPSTIAETETAIPLTSDEKHTEPEDRKDL